MFKDINKISSIFTFKLNLNKEYEMMINDMLRLSTIVIIVNLMFYLQNSNNYSFFSAYFCQMLIYILLGCATFWLVITKLISFKSTQEQFNSCGNSDDDNSDDNSDDDNSDDDDN